MNEADRDIVERLLRGDARGFDEFFNEYYPKLYRFVKRRVADSALAEDVAQGTLCRALTSLRGFRGEAALYTWLCTLCRRELSANLAATRPAAGFAHLTEDEPAVRAALESLLANESTDPLLATDRAQLRQAIRVTLDYLPSPYGDILEWKYLRDLSIDAIAQRLGRSPKAAESLLTRAREAFREAFTLLAGAPATGDR
jgi:RNA polymerase sigma-70 factor (ECF subfamily)